jgi:CheY-like chemotaxis protein
MRTDIEYPTVLVVHGDREFRDVLIRKLQQKGYLVLEAQNAAEASDIVVRHSRSIHLLVADDSDSSRGMAERLKPYRPSMNVVRTGSSSRFDLILTEVAKALDPPGH